LQQRIIRIFSDISTRYTSLLQQFVSFWQIDILARIKMTPFFLQLRYPIISQLCCNRLIASFSHASFKRRLNWKFSARDLKHVPRSDSSIQNEKWMPKVCLVLIDDNVLAIVFCCTNRFAQPRNKLMTFVLMTFV